jgi:hypothetical protein
VKELKKAAGNIVFACLLTLSVSVFGEERFTLEEAVRVSFAYARERIPDGSLVRVSEVFSGYAYENVRKYILEEWLSLTVNDETLSAVARGGGDVFSISGSFDEAAGSAYTLQIRLVAPVTEEILALKQFTVVRSATLTKLINPTKDSGEGMYAHWLGIGLGTQFSFPIIEGEPLMKSYTENYYDPSPFGFGFNLMVSAHILKFFALQSDIIFQWNRVAETGFWGSFDDTRIQFTALAKLAFSLFDIVALEAFAGIYLDVPIGELKYSLVKQDGEYTVVSSTPYSVQPGFVAGIRTILWFAFFDYRFGVDFMPTAVDSYNGQSGDLYRRYFFSISMGIQLGFIKK